METDRVQKSLDIVLSDVGVASVVDHERSQVLDLGDYVFVEVVLTDATKQEEVERAVKELSESQKKRGEPIDYVVRSIWVISRVQQSNAISISGVMKAAIPFVATLVSGQRTREMPVSVTYSAVEFLKTSPLVPGLSQSDLLKAAVKEYLEEQLRAGGTSYWDPLKYPVPDLNEPAMLFLSRYGTEFYQLKWSIDDFFDTVNNRHQLESLVARHVNLLDFENGLSELSSQLGGAIGRTASTPTSARELFEALVDYERRGLKFYYEKKVTALSNERRTEFPSLFREPGRPVSD